MVRKVDMFHSIVLSSHVPDSFKIYEFQINPINMVCFKPSKTLLLRYRCEVEKEGKKSLRKR